MDNLALTVLDDFNNNREQIRYMDHSIVSENVLSYCSEHQLTKEQIKNLYLYMTTIVAWSGVFFDFWNCILTVANSAVHTMWEEYGLRDWMYTGPAWREVYNEICELASEGETEHNGACVSPRFWELIKQVFEGYHPEEFGKEISEEDISKIGNINTVNDLINE